VKEQDKTLWSQYYKRTTTQMVWSHISDGFQQDSTTSDRLDPSALQNKERTSSGRPRVSWTSTVKKDLDLLGLTWDEALEGSNEGSLGMERLYCPMCFYSTRKD